MEFVLKLSINILLFEILFKFKFCTLFILLVFDKLDLNGLFVAIIFFVFISEVDLIWYICFCFFVEFMQLYKDISFSIGFILSLFLKFEALSLRNNKLWFLLLLSNI